MKASLRGWAGIGGGEESAENNASRFVRSLIGPPVLDAREKASAMPRAPGVRCEARWNCAARPCPRTVRRRRGGALSRCFSAIRRARREAASPASSLRSRRRYRLVGNVYGFERLCYEEAKRINVCAYAGAVGSCIEDHDLLRQPVAASFGAHCSRSR